MNIGKRIRELREERGIMQKYLAERANLTPDQLSKIEKGYREVKAEILPGIASVLQIPKEQYYIFFE